MIGYYIIFSALLLGLDSCEEGQVERAGDLDGFQGEGGRAEREGDRVNHLGVHQQLGTLTTVAQTSLNGKIREHRNSRELDHMQSHLYRDILNRVQCVRGLFQWFCTF